MDGYKNVRATARLQNVDNKSLTQISKIDNAFASSITFLSKARAVLYDFLAKYSQSRILKLIGLSLVYQADRYLSVIPDLYQSR